VFDPPTVELDEIESIHMIGVGGSGMSGLAKLLTQRGIRVTGSDVKPSAVIDSLAGVGVETWIGHRPDRITDVDVVVASSAVPDQDPELEAARRAGVTTARRPALLRGVTTAYPTIGFSGTHGKTSSTAMAVAALRACGKDPSFIVGGEIADLNTGAHLGDPDLLILEADEAFGTFRLLELAGLTVTNIEADHLDYYRTVTALEEAFAQVSNRVDGPVLGCIDDPGVRRLAERSTVIGYGTSSDAAWRIGDVTLDAEPSFSLTGHGRTRRVKLTQPGIHVVRNAAGVLSLLGELGFDLDCAIAGLDRLRDSRTRNIRGGAEEIRAQSSDRGSLCHRRLRPPPDRSESDARSGTHDDVRPALGGLPTSPVHADGRARSRLRLTPCRSGSDHHHRRVQRR